MSKSGRNPRSVLTLSSESYKGAHYATFPRALVAPLIRATCPTRCCPVCGAGWAAVVERPDFSEQPKRGNNHREGEMQSKGADYMTSAGQAWQNWRNENPDQITGYRPTCDCYGKASWAQEFDVAHVPGIVFDPFVGSGTTLQVARDLGLRGIGLDLAHSYLDQQAKVRAQVSAPSDALDALPLFAGIEQPARGREGR